MMKGFNKKDNLGITLVALVITIIILLILAGIAISQLTGSGLFENSKLAQEKYENAAQKEEIELAKYENEINNYLNGSRDYTPINYSTNEQDTGTKWIDGSVIYSKLIDFGYSYKVDNECASISTSILPTNMDIPINAYFYIIDTDNNLKVLDYCTIWKEGNDVSYRAIEIWNATSTRHVYLYLEYTKASSTTSNT